MSIAKIDIDVKMDKNLLGNFLKTRREIIRLLGYTLLEENIQETQKGYHFWFTLLENLSDKELCDLQFLLGDDQTRCRFNYLRLDAGCFRQFNVLFNKKFKGNQNNNKNVERGEG
jgi:hypothetical protein